MSLLLDDDDGFEVLTANVWWLFSTSIPPAGSSCISSIVLRRFLPSSSIICCWCCWWKLWCMLRWLRPASVTICFARESWKVMVDEQVRSKNYDTSASVGRTEKQNATSKNLIFVSCEYSFVVWSCRLVTVYHNGFRCISCPRLRCTDWDVNAKTRGQAR